MSVSRSTTRTMGHAARLASFLAIVLLCLISPSVEAYSVYWENPRPVAEGNGRFPLILNVGKDLLVLWQEAETPPGATDKANAPGQAWLSLARYDGTNWETRRRAAGPYQFLGTEPPLFSASAEGKRVAIAASNGDGKIAILLSSDGGQSFRTVESLAPSSAAVAPRIFFSAGGGYILFATQGDPGNEVDSLSLSYSTSQDGSTWEKFRPLVSPEDGISRGLNFLPVVERLPGKEGKDIVVFQSYLTTKPQSFQLYSKTSVDGGKTWSAANRLTTFADPDSPSAEVNAYDNERPDLAMVAGRLWLTWERRASASSARDTPQIYALPLGASGHALAADLEKVSTAPGTSSAPRLLEIEGQPAVTWFDDNAGQGQARVFLARRDGLNWPELYRTVNKGPASFGSAAFYNGKTYSVWQGTDGGRDRVYLLEPDHSAAPPGLNAENFSPGKRSRNEVAQVSVDLPQDSSGIAGYSWTWSRDPAAKPPRELVALPKDRSLRLPATADGPWYLAAACLDYAGNWSSTARIRFDRDRTPPTPPVLIPADIDEAGFLSSSSFGLRWITPENRDGSPVDDVAGYTWDLSYIGGLKPSGTKTRPAPKAAGKAGAGGLPGLSAWEAGLVAAAGPRVPPPILRTTRPETSFTNLDDGYYLFSVAAIDATGNIGDASTILLRANKYIPYTTVTTASVAANKAGQSYTAMVIGKGFSIDGYVERLVLDRDGKEPYDLDASLDAKGFRILSDTELDLSYSDLPAASYRIGIFHPKRGWYWTRPVLNLDPSGTFKFGEAPPPYKPSWVFSETRSYRLTIYDLIVALSVLFFGLGILLLSRQAVAAARDAETVRLEVLALVSGGSMPSQAKATEAKKLRRRGAGLRLKVSLTIAALVIFVVLLVAIPLGVSMIRSESATLADGLRQKVNVLLESVAQGGRTYLFEVNDLQLSFLPAQAQAIPDARYITVTGYGSAKSTDPDILWATNDPDISVQPPKKIDTDKMQTGVSRLTDSVSPLVPEIMKTINDRAAAEVSDLTEAIAAINKERDKLRLLTDEVSNTRYKALNDTVTNYRNTIAQRLAKLSDSSIGVYPAFDPSLAAQREANYIFYKPILFDRDQDELYYRGLVRLEVSTKGIVKTLQDETQALIRRTALFAAIALGLGLIGAFILSSVIVIPIRKVVKAIERIRDTEDKSLLHDLAIEVKSRDEIRTLADTINEMTDGLVKAAKASKDLILGKGIQKMFIPLDPSPDGRAKLSTGHHDAKDYEIFGYYEGADEVSGDYWDFHSINERYHYFIKCDVSGHGVPAALIMVQVATMVINYFKDWEQAMPKSFDLSNLAYKINDFLCDRKFVGKFAAFTLGVYDSKEGIAYLCEAGDTRLHIWSEREGKLVEHILPNSPAAGPLDSFMIQSGKGTAFTQVTKKLEKGDILFLYTDGIDEANHHFYDAQGRTFVCKDAEDNVDHTVHHKGGQDSEEFGYDRLSAVLEAIQSKGSYRMVREHVPDEVLSFDFSGCDGSLEEKIISLVAVEKVFRMFRDSLVTEKSSIVVDGKVDEFLRKKARFDQIRLYLGPDDQDGNNPNIIPLNNAENPGYVIYKGVREDPQDDDLTFLAIRRK